MEKVVLKLVGKVTIKPRRRDEGVLEFEMVIPSQLKLHDLKPSAPIRYLIYCSDAQWKKIEPNFSHDTFVSVECEPISVIPDVEAFSTIKVIASKISIEGSKKASAPKIREEPKKSQTEKKPIINIPVNQVKIVSPMHLGASLNPRKYQLLLSKVKKLGKIPEPILVRKSKVDNSYELIDGLRRLRVAQELSISIIPAIVEE